MKDLDAMRQLVFQRITRPLDLRQYQPEMAVEIQVWVNPPRAMVNEVYGLLAKASAFEERARNAEAEELARLGPAIETAGQELAAWFATIWSEGAEETRWSEAEVQKLIAHSVENDPQLWPWLVLKSVEMIQVYRSGEKKR